VTRRHRRYPPLRPGGMTESSSFSGKRLEAGVPSSCGVARLATDARSKIPRPVLGTNCIPPVCLAAGEGIDAP